MKITERMAKLHAADRLREIAADFERQAKELEREASELGAKQVD